MTQIIQISPEHRAPDIQLTFSEIHGGNSAQRKKSEQGFEPPHGIFLEKIWIHSFYHHPKIHLHWAFQPWVKHSRLFGCNFIQKMPFPKRRFSHIQWGHLKWKLQQRHLDTWQDLLVNDVSLASTRKPPMWIYHRKSCIQFWPLLKKIDNEKQRNLWTFRNFHKYPQRRWLHIPNQIPQRHTYSSRPL